MTTQPRLLLLWPYGIIGAESIPMCLSFLVPRIRDSTSFLSILDCSLRQLAPHSSEFASAVTAAAPDIIGISSWSQNWRWVGMTIEVLRALVPHAKIVLGGPHVTATGDIGGADYALTGEAEWSFPLFIDALGADMPPSDMECIPGLRYRNQRTTTPTALVQDLDALGLPDFDAMLLRDYQQKGYKYRSGEILQAPILATRGCPYTCSFCEAPLLSGRKIRKHSIAYLKELLIHLRVKYHTKHINIVDDNFTFHKDYAKEFCAMVLQTPICQDMTFATPNGLRVERSDAEMFRLMKTAGWEWVIFAPESGSQRMVDIMAKHLDLGILGEKVAQAHDAGLKIESFFILNYPGETDADVELTRQFIEKTPFDAIALHIFKPLPHTPIWRDLVESGRLPPDHIIGRYDEVEWLANGRTKEDITRQIALYGMAAKHIGRIA